MSSHNVSECGYDSGYESPIPKDSNQRKPGWPRDIMNSVASPVNNASQNFGAANFGNFVQPDDSLRGSEVSGAAGIPSSIEIEGKMNMSMYNVYPTHDMHASIMNQTPTNLNQMHASSRAPYSSMYQKSRALTPNQEDKDKNKRCVIHLKSEQKLKTNQDPQVHGPDRPSEAIKSEFLLEHDANYLTGACFHLNF